ncbi:MAG TPA: TetR/AcrR family transcriptional regulator [Pseudonocardiaceae bacterium]|jgi:AcrR family transcriptional regulator|nr:TetR/AcrR family transcriptional regulator [Pseudonocardiaceae bacterium]
MTSSCNSDEVQLTRSPATRVDSDTLLDAARTCVLSVGVRRTTLTDIARRAGVSRMTVYRRFADVTSVMAALMTREFSSLLTEADRSAREQPDARAHLVAATLAGVRALRADPLMISVLDRDPELLLPYLFERIGSTQRLIEAVLVEQITVGHRDGSIRAGDPAVQSRAIFLTGQAFVISHRPSTTDIDGDDLLAELGRALDGALTPAPTSEDR